MLKTHTGAFFFTVSFLYSTDVIFGKVAASAIKKKRTGSTWIVKLQCLYSVVCFNTDTPKIALGHYLVHSSIHCLHCFACFHR